MLALQPTIKVAEQEVSMSKDPWAPENNLYHTMTYQSKEDWWDENFPKGPADGDAYGYPGQEDDTTNQ